LLLLLFSSLFVYCSTDDIPLGVVDIGAHGRTTVVSVSLSESEKKFLNLNIRDNIYLCNIPILPKSSSALCVTVASDRICIGPLVALIVLV
jgi:hypothetical protein